MMRCAGTFIAVRYVGKIVAAWWHGMNIAGRRGGMNIATYVRAFSFMHVEGSGSKG
jgi:hypothetical protein